MWLAVAIALAGAATAQTASVIKAINDFKVPEGAFQPVQTISDRIQCPSPEPAGMMRYQEAVMNYSEGTAMLSVPIYRLTVGNYSLDVGLNYQVRAFKAEEEAGWVGLGWTLGCAGAVTREIKGCRTNGSNTKV